MRCVINRNLPGQLHHRALRSAITRTSSESYHPQDARHIDNPPSITTRMDILLHHLCDRVLAAQEHAPRIDPNCSIERLICRLVDGSGRRALDRDPGIVYHTISTLISLSLH